MYKINICCAIRAHIAINDNIFFNMTRKLYYLLHFTFAAAKTKNNVSRLKGC